MQSPDPVAALRESWDDYVRFAAARPRLYAAMMSRVLNGAHIPAAEQAFALLIERVSAIAADGRLALTIAAAADALVRGRLNPGLVVKSIFGVKLMVGDSEPLLAGHVRAKTLPGRPRMELS